MKRFTAHGDCPQSAVGCGRLGVTGSEVDTADITDHTDSWYLKKDLVFEHIPASVTETMLADGSYDGELLFLRALSWEIR